MDSKEILSFWFEKGYVMNSKKWFIESYKYDIEIKEKFEKVLSLYENEKGDEYLKTKETFIAFIILLDQMPRQIYRNNKKAFAFDEKVMKFTDKGFENYIDKLKDVEILFAFMPYIHTENNIYKTKGQELINKIEKQLGRDNKVFINIKKNYENHKKVFDKFGRFPKRNIVLNRLSSIEEKNYLNERKNNYY